MFTTLLNLRWQTIEGEVKIDCGKSWKLMPQAHCCTGGGGHAGIAGGKEERGSTAPAQRQLSTNGT